MTKLSHLGAAAPDQPVESLWSVLRRGDHQPCGRGRRRRRGRHRHWPSPLGRRRRRRPTSRAAPPAAPVPARRHHGREYLECSSRKMKRLDKKENWRNSVLGSIAVRCNLGFLFLLRLIFIDFFFIFLFPSLRAMPFIPWLKIRFMPNSCFNQDSSKKSSTTV